jgi:hypothetical protein
MKKMKTTIAAAIALAACASTQLFAQNIKQDTITFSLTLQGQASVSTSASVANAGNFSQGPLYYKTSSKKFTQTDLLKAIAYVMHNKNASFYSSQASLVLVQGELGGFWNIGNGLAQSYEDISTSGFLLGSFNSDGTDSTFYDESVLNDAASNELFNGFPDVDASSDPYAYVNELATFVDTSSRTSISDNINENAQLDTGRHFLPVPFQDDPNSDVLTPLATTGEFPVGHMQPWGQIYVKDPGHKDSAGDNLCENVTFFFFFAVEECYDCFYLSSFISDATFKDVNGTQSGPPCCTAPGFLTGRGVDKYYMSLSFDNTIENEYLNPAWTTNESVPNGGYFYEYVGFTGINVTSANIASPADGLTPDLLKYSDPIRSHLGVNLPYETRFTLNGIVTYTWALTLVNPTDAAYDYVGTANFAANGFGFIGLVCDLITGSATFSEKIVKETGCCTDENWWEDVDNSTGFGLESLQTGWYGVGSAEKTGVNGLEDVGYFNPAQDEFNPYPFYNIVGGESFTDGPTFNTVGDLPFQYESPLNPGPALTRHGVVHPAGENGTAF